MRSLWSEKKYVKTAARLLNRDWVNKGGLDLSKEVLWVSVGWRALLALLSHTDLEGRTVRKKVQTMRLYPDSNLPNSGLKFIKKQNLVYAEFLNWPICNFPMLKLIQIERKNGNFQALNCRNLFRKVFNLLWRVMYVRHRLKKSKIVCSIQNCVKNIH